MLFYVSINEFNEPGAAQRGSGRRTNTQITPLTLDSVLGWRRGMRLLSRAVAADFPGTAIAVRRASRMPVCAFFNNKFFPERVVNGNDGEIRRSRFFFSTFFDWPGFLSTIKSRECKILTSICRSRGGLMKIRFEKN